MNKSFQYAISQANHENNLQFTNPQSIQEADMLEYLNSLSPRKRTELLGELYSQWETWRNEQMLIGVKVK